jgi:hypothetical protein
MSDQEIIRTQQDIITIQREEAAITNKKLVLAGEAVEQLIQAHEAAIMALRKIWRAIA